MRRPFRVLNLIALLCVEGVIASAATVTLTGSTGTAVFGSAVTLTATVTPGTASGKVTFYDGTTVLGTRNLTSGSASLVTSLLASGSDSLTAHYAGDTNNAAARSAAVSIAIHTLPQAGFAPDTSYPTGGIPVSVVSADFNGDGKADLAVASQGTNNVNVFLGNGNGTFQAPLNYSVGTTPYSVAAGDFNGDGNTDLVVANSGDNNVSVLLGNGDGTFAASLNYKVGTFPAFVAVGDFNQDGIPDLAVANRTDGTISILSGQGDGTFQLAGTLTPTATNPQSIAVADLNGDGKPDLVVANTTGNLGKGDVSVFLGNGDGTFRPAVEYIASTNPISVAVADFNGDGIPDVAVGNINGNGLDVSVLIGNGNGTFQAAVNYAAGKCNTITVGDFNGDGIADLAAGMFDAPVAVLLGNGDGTFGAAAGYGASFIYSIAVGDFNGNGRSDLAGADNGLFFLDVLPGKQPGSTISLSSPANSAALGQSVTLTASIAATPGGSASFPAPTGSVTFYDGTAVLGIQTLVSNSASLSTKLLSSGAHSLHAYYGGDVVYSGSISTAISQTINALPEDGLAAGVNYPAGVSTVTGIASGDFNGDGIVDLAVSDSGAINGAPFHVNVFVGNGDGTFQPAVSFDTGGQTPSSVASGDFNGDGMTDLVVTNSVSNNLSILIGNGNGTFEAAVLYPTGNNPSYLATGDFNGDGKTDIAVANSNDNTISVMLGKGDGSFQSAVTYATGSVPCFIAVGDLNGDGAADLVVANTDGGTVSVFAGNGDGTFQTAGNYAAGASPASVSIADFNRDGKPDLAVANGSTVSLLQGNGNGTFQAATNIMAGTKAYFAMVGDLNGDGLVDLAVRVGPDVAALLGNGDGTFQSPVDYSVPPAGTFPGGGTYAGLVADFNGDGRSDIAVVVVGMFGSSISILLGQAPPATTTMLSSSASPSAYGSAVTLTASVTPSTAAGRVTFFDGTTILGTGALSAGQAALSTSLLASGVRSLRAYYEGGPTGAASSSTVLKLIVNTLPEAGLGLAVSYNYGSPFAVGDFNGDGQADLVTIGNSSVNILLNRGNGVFGAPVNYFAWYQPTGVVTGDFNGDGNADLAVISSSGGTIAILLGNGDGTFRPPTSFNVGYNIQAIAVGDLNGDGKADLVAGFAVSNTGSGVNVYLGNGDGTFQTAVNYLPGVAAWSVAVGDFNADGKADLAVANGVSGLIVLIGSGNGSFLPAVTYGAGSGPRSVAVGDINGDGIADVITGNYYGNSVSVFLGKGDGTFQTASGVSAGSYPASIALGDFNGDGKPDLVVADSNFNNASNGNTVVILFGKGDGTFSGSTTIGVGANPSLVLVGDFNGDSLDDLAVAAGSGVELLKGIPIHGTISANVGLASSANPSTYGQNLRITAAVTPSVATGRVAFYDAGALLETVPITAGVAVLQTSLLNSGLHSLQALYSGDTTYEAVSSAVLTQTVNPIAAQGFGGGPSYAVVNGATSIAVGDFNGDGQPDIAVGSTTGVSVLLAGGGATFLPAVNYAIASGVIAIATGDFNGDGKLDLITLNHVLFGNGDGTFQAPINIPTPAGWNAGNQTKLFVADFNGDGFADVLLTDAGQNNWAILLGNGDGTFASKTYTGTGAVGLGDFNGDGKPDIVLSETSLTGMVSLVVMLGNGDGTFSAAASGYVLGSSSSTSTGPIVEGVTTGNFNGDRKLDIAVSIFTYSSQNSELMVLAGNGDGTFQLASQYALPGQSGALAASDFNGDGKLDLAVGDNGGVAIYYGQGNGNLQATYPFAAPTSVIVTGDFNGDGRVDLIAAGGGRMDVFFGLGPLTPTTTTLTTSPNPSVYYQAVTLTATVSSGATGQVDFYQGVTLLGSSAISGGSALFATSSLTSWGGTLKAVYGGDSSHSVSSSAPLVQKVTPVPVSRLSMQQTYAAGTGTVAMADLNGDGNVDMVVETSNSAGIGVFLGNGDGTFQAKLTYGSGIFDIVAVADFNGDGKPDILAGGENVSLFLGNGDGTFQTATVLATRTEFAALSLSVGDFNGDGKLDIAFVEDVSGEIGVLLGNGDGTFLPSVNYYAGASPESITAGDFNSDGKTDLAVANYGDNSVSVLIGIGNGTFESPVNYPAGDNPKSIVAADFNGDGYPDLAVADLGGNGVSVLLGSASGTFSAAVYYTTGQQAYSVALGDFNGDGKADLIVANHLSNTLTVLAGYGTGTFFDAATYSAKNFPLFVTTADVNGDGMTDAAFVDDLGNVSILLGVGTGPAYRLNTAVFPANSGTISMSPKAVGNDYISGSTVCLTASPAAGQIFTGWTGTALNAAGCLTITAGASVTANFTANPVSASSALRFVPVAPCRLVDTRNANGPLGGPSVGAQTTRSFTVAGTCNIPSTALAYSLNLTVVPQGLLGYVSMWPTGQSQPVVSTLNSLDGRVKSNAAIVPAGSGGAVSVFATDMTDVILDISGYFDSYTDDAALQFFPLTPCRVADTRNAAGLLGGPSLLARQSRSFPILSSTCGIPGNALAYSLNFTAIPQAPLGYLTVWPDGQSQPPVSTLNAPTAAVTANAAIVPAGNGGAIELFVTDNSDMAIDINGYFAAPASGGLSLYNLMPCRIEDTRNPSGTPAFTGSVTETATGVACGVPPEARSLVLNATVVPSGALGFLSLWANGGSQPGVSTLNSLDGSITSNMAVVPTTNGLVNAYAAGPGATYLILDIAGYFAP